MGDAPTNALVAVKANTAFAVDLYGKLKSQPGNIFFSPYSISTALEAVYEGARGNTKNQMSRVLHVGYEPKEFQTSLGDLQRWFAGIGQQGNVKLEIANSLWIQTNMPIFRPFLQTAKTEYQADIYPIDFRKNPAAAAELINQWVSQKTAGKIQNIVPSEGVSKDTGLVVANAVYFKGVWESPFKKKETSFQPFYLSTSNQLSVSLMHEFENVKYIGNNEIQAIELPYKGDDLSMLIILPRQVDGCSQLENKLSPMSIASTVNWMKSKRVDIFLPGFHLESSFDLKDSLSELGMVEAFSRQADFSGIDGTKLLYISDIFHKTWVDVNEEGTEAAAATGIFALRQSADIDDESTPVFRADHPFIFLIRDTQTGAILFMGRLANPSSN